MSEFNQKTYDKLKHAFTLVSNKINNYETRDLPKDKEEKEKRITQYKTELIDTYNQFISYIDKHFKNFQNDSKTKVREKVNGCKSSVLRALTVLELKVELPEKFEIIDIEKITDINDEQAEDLNDSQIFFMPNQASTSSDHDTNQTIKQNILTNSEADQIEADIMTLSKLDFLGHCSRTINYIYNGDALGLMPFINAVELLKSVCENDDHKGVLLQFVKTKLQSRALECLPDTCDSIDELIKELKNKIKPENSDVVEGRLMALKADKTNFGEYSQKAENLAEAFKRSLLLEGVAQDTAQKMTVKKTVELCRANTSSSLVKSVLASSNFTDAKEVIAKFMIESRNETTERQILFYHQNNYRGRGRGNFRNRGNFRGGWYNNYNNNYNSNFDNNDNGNNNYRGNFRGRGGGGRGRGRPQDNVFVIGNDQGNSATPPSGEIQQVELNQAEHLE